MTMSAPEAASACASVVIKDGSIDPRGLLASRTAMPAISIGRPIRAAKSSEFSTNNLATAEPTVPPPSSAIVIGADIMTPS